MSSAGIVAIIALAFSIIGVGVRLIVAFKAPESPLVKSALGNIGYACLLGGLAVLVGLAWNLYSPLSFQPPLRWVKPVETPTVAQPIISPTPIIQSSGSIAQASGNHIGTTFSLQLAQMLGQLPKPCTVKLTTQSNDDLASVIVWVVSYGSPLGGAICSLVGKDTEPPDIDNPKEPKLTSDPGAVVHWDKAKIDAQPIAHFFDSSGVKVSISHRLPPNPPVNFVWIDIGPGSPWK